jgi:hypothetical protein
VLFNCMDSMSQGLGRSPLAPMRLELALKDWQNPGVD